MKKVFHIALLVVAMGVSPASAERIWRGYFAVEARAFPEDPLQPVQSRGVDLSVVAEPELELRWKDGRQRFVAKGFLRLDGFDDERSHGDIRELYWERATREWELRVGISKVFWGVTESQHLVDVINQTDLIENLDTEDKLGQPMVKLTFVRNWGIVDLFVLPGFRERTFPGAEGRLRGPFPIDTDHPLYESSREERHIDLAGRWSHAIGPFDLGLSYFRGTNREPKFVPQPFYDQTEQFGLDTQATTGSWLWKLEGIHVKDSLESSDALTAGFEYTFWGVGGTPLDVGVLAEYLWNDRRDPAANPFDDDLFVGARLAFNDRQNSSILVGGIVDPTSGAVSGLVETSRRMGNDWVLEAELRTFRSGDRPDPLDAIRRDDFLQVSLQRHF